MDIRQLRQFQNLAHSLHFGRAAAASHVSPSALSRSIRQLEGEVGATLFTRDNRSVELTSAGVAFLSYAREAVSQWEVVCHQLQVEAGELQGEVSIYCSVTASYSFLFELLNRFRREHPRIEIKLHTGDSEHAVQRVLAGEEDMAIGARPEHLHPRLAFKPIARSPLVFVAANRAAAYASLAHHAPTAELWNDVPMILSESGLARDRVDRWFAQHDIQPRIYAQVGGNEAIVSMVSLGFGVGVVPRIVLDNSPLADTVSVLPVQPELAAYEVGLLVLNKKLRSPLISAFWSQSRTAD
ncbi:MAG: HTH-type transcriptional activator IlvY [Gammaproteobacteria bacterium]|jgi:LysR family positive regulator for ilvC|nr:HTH-type transcriptional activator IlvY [Gammaproteobacteria bacterium]